ncbi:hypothetical protein T190_07455 [Sinorhizobium meliloti CCBAU 01290]|nr:hypothetical protein T190_07455 [Sinorhizobium meliloti CCBAU 01290]
MGASGAVGGALLQLARSRGWIVHAVCSAAQSARVLRLGAATVLDYRQDGGVKSPPEERKASRSMPSSIW